ncbi:DoxX family protein [Agrococcus beijingensis]|uniref:DoxX family protein n=1 Tax=Agrococcus beijingensis TaxID=3068634 RepID=UPI00274071C5|nr:DoxX family membrane protein [Agrococcus sp. REN33]
MAESTAQPAPRRSPARTVVRLLLGAFLLFAGTGHLTFARTEFQAQVPAFLPFDPDVTVVASGVVEIVLGLALLLARRRRAWVGLATAAFFIAVFPGNVAQWLEARDGFGLDSDAARFGRLFFQPVLVVAALWATGAWTWLVARLRGRSAASGRDA